MKNLIKKILREQWSPEAIQDLEAFHPDLFELDEQETTGDGSWKNPFDTPTPGNVPTQSYEARHEKRTKSSGHQSYHLVPVPKIAFFKATELLTKMKDDAWFSENEDRGESTYYRGRDMETPLKVVGINNSGVEDKVFWAAFDNYSGLRDGSITNYDQLYLRPFKRYEAPMYETARVYKTISFLPKINAFSSEDAENNIMYDEDGAFHSGEWYDEPGYEESDDDWETTDGPNSDGDIKQIGIVYDEQQGLNESLIKEMGPSPEENDIISELNELVQSWDGCEEGMPVACRYKNQVQELITKYKNLPL